MKFSTHPPKHLRFFADEESDEEDEREVHTEATEFLEFSLDEEYAVARWVMDSICLIWMDTKPEFAKFLSQLIWRKSRGKDLSAPQFAQLVNFYERYEDLLSPFPILKDNGKRQVAPKKYQGTNSIEWIQRSVARTWYEIWDQHPHMRRRAGWHKFPNFAPDDKYIGYQLDLEEKFWAEVVKKQTEFDVSRAEAILLVSDYMTRAEEKYQLPPSKG